VAVSRLDVTFTEFEANKLEVTRSIVGLKKEESDALLNFLLAHVGRGIDYQARVRWAPKTVVVWDVRFNRIELTQLVNSAN
jgi:hypothetical protein